MIGTKLGPYEITAAIGAGGMGEVYQAHDSKLKRDVAIKVLPAAFVEDKQRLARFEREAQVLAALNHPHLAAIYGLEESDSPRALVMELVEGPTLAERLAGGPLPVDEALPIARQIAGTLEYAHEHGVIHRDLKPANIKLTGDDQVKVLDFGLAKAMDPLSTDGSSSGSVALSHSPTMTLGNTIQGMILGTAGYMAPEQAAGKAVDRRADIWAFGVVLYEMLSGAKLFEGDSVPETLAGVLKGEIDLENLPEKTPRTIRRLLSRCLERNPKNRLRDIGEARIAIESAILGDEETGRVGAESIVSEMGVRRAPLRRALPWVLAAAALVVGLAVGVLAGRMSGSAQGGRTPLHAELEITAPPKTTFVSGLALSADSRQLALVVRGEDGQTRLWVRSLETGEAKEVPGTIDALYPFWAPDGRRLGFFAQNKLKVIDLLGGSARALADTGPASDVRGGAWNAFDQIVYAPTFVGPLFTVSAEGGKPTQVTAIPAGSDIGTQRFPSFLPDGKRFVFYASTGNGTEPGEIDLGRLGDRAVKRLGPASSAAIYAAPGYLVYVRGDSLVAQRLDLEREALVGEPMSLGITLPGSVAVSGQRTLAVSPAGVLVYRADKRNATRLIWVDRKGTELGAVTNDTDTWFYSPSLSPDGRRIAVSHYDVGSTSGGIWVHDLDRHLATRLTFGEKGDDTLPVWSPDGRELVYSSIRGTGTGIYRIGVSSPGSERQVVAGEHVVPPYAWTDSGSLIYSTFDEGVRGTLWIRGFAPGATPRRLSPPGSYEQGADLSPDGRWLAFESDATRRFEVYVRRLDDSAGTTTARVSTDGGTTPRWRRDGKELFYLDASGRIVSVPVLALEPIRLGTPVPLFDARLEPASDRQYDVSADGQRFLLNRTLITEQAPISVVLGWQERLRTGAKQ